jgi:hypothetical protein
MRTKPSSNSLLYLVIPDYLLESGKKLDTRMTQEQEWLRSKQYKKLYLKYPSYNLNIHNARLLHIRSAGLVWRIMRNSSKPGYSYKYSWYRPQEKKSSVPNPKQEISQTSASMKFP